MRRTRRSQPSCATASPDLGTAPSRCIRKPATVENSPAGRRQPVASARRSTRSAPRHDESAGAELLNVFERGVVLVTNLAHDFLDQVFQRDDAGLRAVFVHDQRHVGAVAPHGHQQFADQGGGGCDVERANGVFRQRLVHSGRVNGQQVLDVNEADDGVGGIAIEGEARIAGGYRLALDLAHGHPGRHHVDGRARGHDIFDRTGGEA